MLTLQANQQAREFFKVNYKLHALKEQVNSL